MRWFCFILLLCLGACSERTPEASRDKGPRIVSLSPAASIMLQDADLEDAIVGRHGWDTVLDPSLPVAGDQTGIDYERLIALAPTHIVIEWGARELPERLVELASSRDIEITPIETLTLADIDASLRIIRSTFGISSDPNDQLFGTQHELRTAWGDVLLVVATSPTIDCLGPGSAHHELLMLGGFTPTLAEGAPWVTQSLEDVIRLNPACIVLVQPGGSPDGSTAIFKTAWARSHAQALLRLYTTALC